VASVPTPVDVVLPNVVPVVPPDGVGGEGVGGVVGGAPGVFGPRRRLVAAE